MLKIAKANAKLVKLQKMTGKRVYSLSTLAGIGCPFAKDCKSTAILDNGKFHIQDGQDTLFRCFSASQEVLFPNVYHHRYHNRQEILNCGNSVDKIAKLISESLPKNCEIFRYHVSGDWFTQNHFDGALQVAIDKPNILFYCYTKSLPFWIKRLGQIPPNLSLIASRGGRADNLIEEFGLRSVVVVANMDEFRLLNQNAVVRIADGRKLLVDHNDYKAAFGKDDFALLIHGIQPKGSKAAKAWNKIKGTIGGYSDPLTK